LPSEYFLGVQIFVIDFAAVFGERPKFIKIILSGKTNSMAAAGASNLDIEDNRTSFNYKINASFLVNSKNNPSQCQIVYQKEKITWEWHMDLRHYEVIQDLYRLLLTIPDQIATAISILQEQEQENGAFLIIQLNKSIREYRQKIREITVLPSSHELSNRILFSYTNKEQMEKSSNQPFDLEEVLNNYLAKLEAFEELLRFKNQGLVLSVGKDIVLQSDKITICCQIFLDLVYPVWRSILRIGKWDTKNIDSFCRRMRQKLVTNKGLYPSYLQYMLYNKLNKIMD